MTVRNNKRTVGPAAFESANSTHFSGTPQTVALPQTTAGGDLIIVTLTQTVNSTVSGAGATWVQLQSQQGTNPSLQLWYGYNAVAGNTTIGVTQAVTNQCICLVAMYSGMGASDPFVTGTEGTNSNSGTAWTSLTTPTATYESGDLVIAGGATHSNLAVLTVLSWSDGSTNSNAVSLASSGPGATSSIDYSVKASASSTAVTYVSTVSAAGAIVIAGFRPH